MLPVQQSTGITMYNKLTKSLVCASLLASTCAFSAIEIANTQVNGKVTKAAIGGYVKVDVRHVEGDIAYQDYWIANLPAGAAQDTSHTGFNIKESRINFKLQHGDVTGFIEMDFYGGDGNEVVSNSTNPRVRHAFIQYENWLAGQTWTTFMPLHALPEALDFGGPHVGEVFIRQTQVRYTSGNWQFAIENPETNGDGNIGSSSSAVGVSGNQADADESTPDIVARYNLNKDWGTLSFAALVRKVNQGGIDETAFAANIAGKIKTFGKDDLRFQLSVGEPGRYVAAGLTPDLVTNSKGESVIEETIAYTIAYRHFWGNELRTNVFYGAAETDTTDRERSHWGINLMTNIETNLTAGVEFGNYAIDDVGSESIDSNYLQFSAKYNF